MQTTLVCPEKVVASCQGCHSPSKQNTSRHLPTNVDLSDGLDLQRNHLGNLIATVR